MYNSEQISTSYKACNFFKIVKTNIKYYNLNSKALLYFCFNEIKLFIILI